MINSHKLAAGLREFAERLESAPEFEFGEDWLTQRHIFIAAEDAVTAKAFAHVLKPCTKTFTETQIKLTANFGAVQVQVEIPRQKVCELVEPAKPAVYRCDPLLSADEEAEIAGAAMAE